MLIILVQITLGFLSFSAEPRPVFTPDSFTIDYDTIEYGGNGKRKLNFKNTGDAPLIIEVKSSCGCLVPDYPKEPTSPGHTNWIGAHYDTKREGRFMKTLTVTTNEPAPNNIHVIKVIGYVKPAPPMEIPAPAK